MLGVAPFQSNCIRLINVKIETITEKILHEQNICCIALLHKEGAVLQAQTFLSVADSGRNKRQMGKHYLQNVQ